MKRLPRKLDEIEIRVLGCLLEKEQATPDYYPMTVNAVTQACNQKTNRDPVMALTSAEAQNGLDRLFNEDVFAWRSRAGRATKWKQNVDRRWQLTPATKAVMTLLLLRGPQTPGELRSRSERLHAFDDLAAVEETLVKLARHDEPLVRELPRQSGQKENRWTHLVSAAAGSGAVGSTAVRSDAVQGTAVPGTAVPGTAVPGTGPGRPAATRPAPSPVTDDRFDRLESRVAELESRLAELETALGGPSE